MKVRLFHGTAHENIESIKEKGILAKFGEVYLTNSVDSACRWTGMRLQPGGKLAVIEVEVEEDELEEGIDHSPMMVTFFGVGKSIVTPNPIPPENIIEIHEFRYLISENYFLR